MRFLCIITTSFPYGSKESFLESEMKYCSGFEKIAIFSSRATGEIRDITLKDNVDYYRINAFEDYYVKNILHVLFFLEFWKELFCLLKSGRFSVFNLKLLIKESLIGFNTYFKIKNIAKKKYDNFKNTELVIYSYWLSDHALTNILLFRKFKARFNCSRVHRFDLYEEEALGGYLPYRKLYLKKIKKIFPISIDGYKYVSHYNIAKDIRLQRLGVIDNGINPEDRESDFIIISCSWCQPVKRIDLIIKALASITDKKIRWIHFGDGVLYNNLKKMSNQLLPPNITYMFPGEVPNMKILDYYKSHHVDLFINVSSSEGIPVSIMEAISFGIPVIGTNVGGTSEIVINETTGFLLDSSFKVDILTQCIRNVINMNFDDYNKLRHRARKYWAENFDASINYKLFYESL